MWILIIAAAHILPPVLGALLAEEFGLYLGTLIGVIVAIFTGALIIPDLMGVVIGYYIGKCLID